jgi:tetratricopeptide (TPR) repeat protein
VNQSYVVSRKLMKTKFRGSWAGMFLAFWTLFFSSGAASAAQDTNPDALPMFGQPAITRPDELKKADELFIATAIAKYGNRNAASRASVAQGWSAIRSGNPAMALRRFNEGWLLNPENPGAFWGFGAVLSEQGRLAEAIKQLETSRGLMKDEKQLVQLLADIGAVRSAYAAGLPRDQELERVQQFSAANQRFAESLEIDSEYARSWRAWAISLYEQERYSEAGIKAARAMELKAEPFPADFLGKLNSKLADPK